MTCRRFVIWLIHAEDRGCGGSKLPRPPAYRSVNLDSADYCRVSFSGDSGTSGRTPRTQGS